MAASAPPPPSGPRSGGRGAGVAPSVATTVGPYAPLQSDNLSQVSLVTNRPTTPPPASVDPVPQPYQHHQQQQQLSSEQRPKQPQTSRGRLIDDAELGKKGRGKPHKHKHRTHSDEISESKKAAVGIALVSIAVVVIVIVLIAVFAIPQTSPKSSATNLCANHQCGNNSTCVVSNGTTVCLCEADYTGANCDAFIYFPTSIGGSNGAFNCSDPLTPCSVHGTCVDTWCHCQPGYIGHACDGIIADACDSTPCQNNGTCVLTAQGSFTCTCDVQFTGIVCDLHAPDPCAGSPCWPGGTCQRVDEWTMVCLCPDGSSGLSCPSPPAPCTSNPCSNGGSCFVINGTDVCSCLPWYQGSTCATNVDMVYFNLTCSPRCQVYLDGIMQAANISYPDYLPLTLILPTAVIAVEVTGLPGESPNGILGSTSNVNVMTNSQWHCSNTYEYENATSSNDLTWPSATILQARNMAGPIWPQSVESILPQASWIGYSNYSESHFMCTYQCVSN